MMVWPFNKKEKTVSNDESASSYYHHKTTYVNETTGSGTERDHRNQGKFLDRYISPFEFQNIYLHTAIGGRIIDLPISDMLRNWRDFNDGYKSIIADAEKAARYKKVIKEWIRAADIFGGAVLVPLIIGQEDLEQPLDLDAIRKGDVIGWRIFDRTIINKYKEDFLNIADDDYERPKYYQLPGKDKQILIHPSRAFELSGIELTTSKKYYGYASRWGLSRLNRCYDSILTYEEAIGSAAQAVTANNIDVLTETGLGKALTTEEQPQVEERARNLSRLKSAWRLIIKDKESEYERHSSNFSGLAPTLEVAQEDLSMACGIPATKLFGKAKAGMSGDTNDGDIRNYTGELEIRQEDLDDFLDGPDRVMIINALGYYPDDIRYAWNEISVTTASEEAAIEKDRADAAETRINSGVIAPVEARDELKDNPLYKLDDAAYKQHISDQKKSEKDNESQSNSDM